MLIGNMEIVTWWCPGLHEQINGCNLYTGSALSAGFGCSCSITPPGTHCLTEIRVTLCVCVCVHTPCRGILLVPGRLNLVRDLKFVSVIYMWLWRFLTKLSPVFLDSQESSPKQWKIEKCDVGLLTHVGCCAPKCAKVVYSLRTVADPYWMQKDIHPFGSVLAKYHYIAFIFTIF
jgi:hypothetical protein